MTEKDNDGATPMHFAAARGMPENACAKMRVDSR